MIQRFYFSSPAEQNPPKVQLISEPKPKAGPTGSIGCEKDTKKLVIGKSWNFANFLSRAKYKFGSRDFVLPFCHVNFVFYPTSLEFWPDWPLVLPKGAVIEPKAILVGWQAGDAFPSKSLAWMSLGESLV